MKKQKHILKSWLLPVYLLISYLLISGNPGQALAQASDAITKPIHQFPFEITSNKPFVQVRVNDSDPLGFILDTGSAGGSLISWDQATALGLPLQGEKSIHTGAGEGVEVKTAWTGGVDFDIHGLKLKNQNATVIQLGHVSEYEGRSLDGTLGFNFINLYVTEIDSQDAIIRLYAPASYEYSGPGRSIPFQFLGGLPVISAAVSLPGRETIRGNFVVDTGSRMAILLNSPFVEKHKLLESEMKFLSATIGGGVGGECKGYVGRLEAMQLGPFGVIKPVAIFSTDKSGVVASDSFDGIIGGGILSRCKTIFDYSRKQLILEPYGQSPRPYEYDMSGLFLIAKGSDFKQFTVQSVVEDSPADEAGLQHGDVINTIDGHPAEEFILEEIRQLFKQDGKEFTLDIQRGENQLEVTFTTKRLV